MDTVSFTRMDQGTKEDYDLLGKYEHKHCEGLADRVLAALKETAEGFGGYKITRYEHGLQTATRAYREGVDEEMVVAALLHDIGDNLAPYNHAAFAATILKPYVSEATWWVVEHHGIFQGIHFWHHVGGNRFERERYKGHKYYDLCCHFCDAWDQTSFDPDYDTLPLEFFEPMVRRLFDRVPYDAFALDVKD